MVDFNCAEFEGSPIGCLEGFLQGGVNLFAIGAKTSSLNVGQMFRVGAWRDEVQVASRKSKTVWRSGHIYEI